VVACGDALFADDIDELLLLSAVGVVGLEDAVDV
jgi:hypothetical protein